MTRCFNLKMLYIFFLFIIAFPVGGKDFTDAAASFLYCRDISYNNEGHLHMSLVVRVQAGAAAETFAACLARSPTCATKRRLISDCFILANNAASLIPGTRNEREKKFTPIMLDELRTKF